MIVRLEVVAAGIQWAVDQNERILQSGEQNRIPVVLFCVRTWNVPTQARTNCELPGRPERIVEVVTLVPLRGVGGGGRLKSRDTWIGDSSEEIMGKLGL